MMNMSPIRLVVAIAILAGAQAFVAKTTSSTAQSPTALSATSDRRAFFVASATGALSFLASTQAASAEERQGIEVTAFNGLIFNYRGGDYGGLEAESLGEPSVTYADFFQKLQADEVEFVEFLAPDGDKAYVTFKSKEGEAKQAPIRIGEGYPIEQHDGFSSPMFCVRAVANKGVKYKFTVPGLSKFST